MNINIENDEIDLSNLVNQNSNDDYIKPVEKIKGKGKGKGRRIKEQVDQPEEEIYPQLKEIQVPKVNYDDIIYKTKLIRKISQYQKVFYELLGNINFNSIDSKSIEELEAILTNIKEIISNRNIDRNVSAFVQYIPFGIEEIGKRAGLELDGYGQYINRDKDYYYTMQEILIENDILDGIKVDNRLRLAYILGLGAYQVHKINSFKKTEINKKLNSSVDATKYSDL